MKIKNIREIIVILASCATILSFLIVVIIPRVLSSSVPFITPTYSPTPFSSSPTPIQTLPPTIPQTPSAILSWARSGQPFINDQLQSQIGNEWSEIPTGLRRCQFSGGTYHASVSYNKSYALCLAHADQDSNLQNIAFQAQVTIIQGDAGGLIFHANPSGTSDYTFTFCINPDPACGKGYYGLFIGQGTNNSQIVADYSAAIKTDLNQTNLLTVVALNGIIYLYINNLYVKCVNDNTFSSGTIGVTAFEWNNPTDVSFSNLQVWKL